ncbi:MAG TPA: hypothetical protein VFS05_08165 [Gemmatimonadaceae bacterium]|nr:hypothetical protein [Gemmatimonadaceae bacterium]
MAPRHDRMGRDDQSREPIYNAPAGTPVGAGVGPLGEGPSEPGDLPREDPLEAASREGKLAAGGVANAPPDDAEDAFWREEYARRPYATADRGWEHYRPAYRLGREAARRHRGRDWPEVEPLLEREWKENAAASTSRIAWHEARLAVRDAWDRELARYPGEETRAPEGREHAGE